MTEEPRQPGPGNLPPEPPTPPPPGYRQAGAAQTGHGRPDANPLDWAIIAAGAAAFIFSLFDYFTYELGIATFSQKYSINAWHGALAPLATLLAAGAAVLLAAQVIGKLQLAFPVRLVVLAAFALASLLLLLALFVMPGVSGGPTAAALGVKIDKGHDIGYWVSLLAVLAGTALSFKRFTDTGGALPTRS